MDTNIRPIDTKTEAIKAMARALAEIGYTRDDQASDVSPADALYATRAMIRRYAELGDMSACFEFITEASPATDKGLITKLTDAMFGDQSDAEALVSCLCIRARWYGESFIPEALDMLDSASEIARDRKVDQDIDERKSA